MKDNVECKSWHTGEDDGVKDAFIDAYCENIKVNVTDEEWMCVDGIDVPNEHTVHGWPRQR